MDFSDHDAVARCVQPRVGRNVGRTRVFSWIPRSATAKHLRLFLKAELESLPEALGFTDAGDGRHFEHKPSGWLVEFPPGPVAFGDTTVSESDIPVIDCKFGKLRVITPTQSLMDRLAAYFQWNRQPDLRNQVRGLRLLRSPAFRGYRLHLHRDASTHNS